MDLNVKDTMPVHGSVELNNRYSADTTPLRLNGSASYDNLWQLGHSIGGSFQLSPEDLTQVKVFSGYYLARVPGVDWLSLELQGTSQDSNVNTLGGIGVVGKRGRHRGPGDDFAAATEGFLPVAESRRGPQAFYQRGESWFGFVGE